jgi:hypothetical protein
VPKPPKLLVFIILLLLILVILSVVLRYVRTNSVSQTTDSPAIFQNGKVIFHLPGSQQAFDVKGLDVISDDMLFVTNDSGELPYLPEKNIRLFLGHSYFATVSGEKVIDISKLPSPLPENFTAVLNKLAIEPKYNALNLPKKLYDLHLDFTQPNDVFTANLEEYLQPEHIHFTPSLGINLESPQAEADMIGQSMPFVDIFRTARPFPEFSCKDVSYDKNGWPTKIPETCGQEKARTLMLQSILPGSVPFGEYTVIYEGKGNIEYGGNAQLIESHPDKGYDIIKIDHDLHRKMRRMIFTITKTETFPNHLKNIRIVMPGGVCKSQPDIRVGKAGACSQNDYLSFSEALKENRNHIIFNPDYLRFLKNFRLVRTMNFLEASPRRPNRHFIPFCEDASENEYLQCVTQPLEWTQRAKMDDVSWGGSFRTAVTQRHGVPLEVAVELANQLGADPWFNIPHNASDDYVLNYAKYVFAKLNPTLKPHIEYSNEVWNTGFWGAHYVQAKGYEAGYDEPIYPFRNADYSARVRFYSKRAVEIFKLWETVFGGSERLIRIMGSNQTSIPTSKDILAFEEAWKHVDALAIAPYFHGCWNREAEQCKDTEIISQELSAAQTVGDVLAILDQPYYPQRKDYRRRGNPYSLSSVLELVRKQAEIADNYGLKLLAYEGGQHLTVRWRENVEDYGKTDAHLLRIFEDANRAEAMKRLYLDLLRGWKQMGGDEFVLFTMPQTFHKWGSFGIKEHLNAPRSQSPKFDAAMIFQESP